MRKRRPYTCGICGFVMHEVGESHREAAHCPRCKLVSEVSAQAMLDIGGSALM